MFRRVWLLVAIVASVVLGPRVFPPAEVADAGAEVVVAAVAPGGALPAEPAPPGRDRSTVTVVLNPPVDASTTSASTVAPPVPAEEVPAEEASVVPPPTTETTVAPSAPPTTDAPSPSTTTTEAPPPPTTTPPPPPPEPAPPAPTPAALSAEHADGTQEGDVSWYDLPGSISGVCAHRSIEKGTVVTVTNLDTGASITCTVDDRGPYSGDEKVLDLHRDEFSRLAPLEQGIFPARLDW